MRDARTVLLSQAGCPAGFSSARVSSDGRHFSSPFDAYSAAKDDHTALT